MDIGGAMIFVCLFTLGCFIFGYVFLALARMAMEREIPSGMILLHGSILLFLFIGYTASGGVLRLLFLACAPAYLGLLTFLQQREGERIADDLVEREVEKWSRAIAADDLNAGAHLFLGNALLARGDSAAAAGEYRRALELDPGNARDLLLFLTKRPEEEVQALREQLPDLEQLAREVRQRSTFNEEIAWTDSEHRDTVGPLPHRELLGYESPEERFAMVEQPSLGEMQRLLEQSPDDTVLRLNYAAALVEAGQATRARAQYEQVLALEPGNADAATALARLTE